MLSTNKPLFDKDVKDLLYKSMYEAFLSTLLGTGEGNSDSYAKKTMKQAADMFAQKFADECCPKLTDLIDKHIRSIGITINSPLAASIIAPTMGGPCSGVIMVQPANVTIS